MAEDAPCKEAQGRESGEKRDPDSLRAQISRLEEEIEALQSRIRGLQAEVRGMQNSLYWKMTGPLRSLARRLPRLTAFGRRAVEVSKDALAVILPRQTAQGLLNNHWHVRADIEGQIAAYREARTRGDRKIVFYTAIFGEYDNLLLPDHIDPDIDYVCFTDRPRNNYGVWQMRAAPYQHPDPTRVARYVKMHPHELFPAHDIAVWLDANIILKGNVRKYIEMLKRRGGDVGLVSHPHRACFYEEAEACRQLKKDAAKAIQEQVCHYRECGLPTNQPLFETGFMVVHLRSKEANEAFRLWWEQIQRFSRRDQLGLAWVIYRYPNLRIVPLLPEGSSVRDHEDFGYFRHTYARALSIPDVLLQLGQIENPTDALPCSELAAGTRIC